MTAFDKFKNFRKDSLALFTNMLDKFDVDNNARQLFADALIEFSLNLSEVAAYDPDIPPDDYDETRGYTVPNIFSLESKK